MLTLHPQSAMEHLHHRFVAADGSGSDGAIAFEATEVVVDQPRPDARPGPAGRAARRRAGPLADPARRQRPGGRDRGQRRGRERQGRRRRRVRAGRRPRPGPHAPAQAGLPAGDARSPRGARRSAGPPSRSSPWSSSSAASGSAVYAFGGSTPQQAISSVNAGQKALDQATADLAKVTGPGIDLVDRRPGPGARAADRRPRAARDRRRRPRSAPRSSRRSGRRSSPASTGCTGSSRSRSTRLFTFKPARGRRADRPVARWSAARTAPRTSSTGRPRPSTGSTSRPRRRRSSPKNGTKTKGGTVATPRFLGVGGQDLLILDSKNVLWRWRPADDTGKGTLTKVTLQGSASLGDDIIGINTFLRPGTRGLYNLYVVDPSEQQIRAYSPAADGSGFPAKPTAWLATARDVSKMTSTYVDGDIFVADGGAMLRFVGGKSDGWDAKEPKDTVLRPAPELLARGVRRRPGARATSTASTSRTPGSSPSPRSDGTYHGQYRLAGGAHGLDRPARRCTSSRAPRAARDPRLDVRRRRQPGDPRRRPGRRADAPAQPAASPASRGPAEGDPEAHQEALTGRSRDPAAGRQSDPADAGRHAGAGRRLLRRVRLGARPPGQRRRARRSTRSSPTGASSRPT